MHFTASLLINSNSNVLNAKCDKNAILVQYSQNSNHRCNRISIYRRERIDRYLNASIELHDLEIGSNQSSIHCSSVHYLWLDSSAAINSQLNALDWNWRKCWNNLSNYAEFGEIDIEFIGNDIMSDPMVIEWPLKWSNAKTRKQLMRLRVTIDSLMSAGIWMLKRAHLDLFVWFKIHCMYTNIIE